MYFSDRSVRRRPILITAKDECVQQREEVGGEISRPMIDPGFGCQGQIALIDQKLSKLLICDYIQLIACIAILRDFEETEAFLKLDK